MGVSSTKQSPLLSDAARGSTCAARVLAAVAPLTWKSATPPAPDASASAALRKPDALPPLRTTILPSKSRTKCAGSCPCATRTCVAPPPSSSSTRCARIADAPTSSCDEWRPCQK